MKQDSFEIEYEYVPSKQSEIKLQKAFEIIFSKIIEIKNYEHTDQISKLSKR